MSEQTTAVAAVDADEQTSAVPYDQMVRDLFKDMGSDVNNALHATVGMNGEVAELLEGLLHRGQDEGAFVLSSDNFVEELGDLRFYMQALWNLFGWETDSFLTTMPQARSVRNILDSMVISTGNMLDAVKKSWAYGRELDARPLYDQMCVLLSNYNDMLAMAGYSDGYVTLTNQTKLLTGAKARYKSGSYSDDQALARADKVEA